MKLAVIPARGGSKRIPGKNIRLFHGKQIIAYSIEAALATQLFDRVMVSTDDAQIAATAERYGAEIPFLRPAALSDDYTGTNAVVKHAIEWHQQQGLDIDYACCIYATAPFLRSDDLHRGYRRLTESGRSFAFSVTSFPFPIQRAIKITADGTVQPFQPECMAMRSQDLEEAYHDAGQFYWGTAAAFIENRPLFSDAAVPVVLPRYRVQDIDTLEDWRRAELMYRCIN